MVGRVGSDLTEMVALPLWAVVVIGGFLAVVGVLAVMRGVGGNATIVARVLLVLTAALVGAVLIDHMTQRELAGDRRALDARAHELTVRAMMPGSALACLDAMAGDAVERSCEKALFATPEATASAVSYVAAQLSLLADGTAHMRRADPRYEADLAKLRRVIELDRFGIVAHVLALREGCSPSRCSAFALLRDPSRVSANMAQRTYASLINRHVAGWAAPGEPQLAGHAPPATAAAPVAAVKPPPSNLFLPSSSSIPAVSIMSAEPTAPADTTGAATTPPAPRKPAQAPARQPAAASARQAPMPLTPAGQ